ncbi:spliceosome-associated protein [Leishmania donovani]|uniref:Spliceosome-associated_protein_-_putative n=3 Tax=Leishmania donovani species complex TaxID=38574 RepID=A0A6L0XJB2_LEIIN|nr:putative spliceosome-associated protein [Leishmania infantum JPCM5]AYU80855.1 spliceosome-associated protein, putative [Leishmania donovani]CAC9512139.1 spliceosome-associated_protein_-_putative [Leishmania infantum]CAJ1990841.1 spliceosome-associated protein [Leishmania donovani]CAM69953.1 putative spliceosome-associated protein [Leishmania infantum JPCM5]SUZ43872.1 spliceosome-associated_protein_-_putative [Leishmania infantum]|eukprot:XP_001466904.1 putative spliceosome-associated protein [Leishmania infantum JPCM5]
MAKSKKEKKAARREREAHLKKISQRIQEKILLAEVATAEGEVEEIVYTLPPTPAELRAAEEEQERQQAAIAAEAEERAAAAAAAKAAQAAAAASAEKDEEDRVVLPSLDGGEGGAKGCRHSSSALSGRKHHRMTWEELKLRAAEMYGLEATELVDQHDGNAVDPLFTVRMKMEPHTVPVPHHWHLQRTFLSRQADREEAVGIVPAEVAALGIEKIRATKDKMATPNQVAFISCFMTGTPLQRKTYNVELSRCGDVFYEGKWRPKAHHTPGVLSKRLRQALGIGPTAPPPWLYSMQTMRRLPPAYPDLRIPGLNAPIPAGGQWGLGQDQWGEPPRAEDNSFLFPGVMDEAAAAGSTQAELRWGTVPPLVTSHEEVPSAAGASSSGAASPAPATAAQALPRPTPAAGRPVITPVPFQPQAYVPQQAVPAARVTPQEYVQVQDNTTNSTVAVGYMMMPKDGVQSQPPPSRYPPAQGS